MSVRTALRTARVSRRGAARWVERGHPWIYRSDVLEPPAPSDQPGSVVVVDERGRTIGSALWSPPSTISLRMLTRDATAIDAAFWRARIADARTLRDNLALDATAYRLVHAEADGLPSLVVDRYGDQLVVQFLSAGLETFRAAITEALIAEIEPAGILARDDASVRSHEGLGSGVDLLYGNVPPEIEVREGTVHYLVAPQTGQKTGAFLDQRENRARAADFARGRALDCFASQGGFAMHMGLRGASVTVIESSSDALERARANARRNQLVDVAFLEANVFDALRDLEESGARFDVIVLDPPAFAKRRDSLDAAARGYKEINLRALRLLTAGGHLLTFSCSFHMRPDRFRAILIEAAVDAGRTVRWIEWRGQSLDHPAIVQIPETEYLKGAILQVV
jgi:23S rRNA (cytosine1962-C5)-methyltransferase